jgi:hypothetical protein
MAATDDIDADGDEHDCGPVDDRPTTKPRTRPARARLRDIAYWAHRTNFLFGPDVSFRSEAEVGRAVQFAASVEDDP